MRREGVVGKQKGLGRPGCGGRSRSIDRTFKNIIRLELFPLINMSKAIYFLYPILFTVLIPIQLHFFYKQNTLFQPFYPKEAQKQGHNPTRHLCLLKLIDVLLFYKPTWYPEFPKIK